MIARNWLGRWEKLYFNRLLKTGKANAHQHAPKQMRTNKR